MFTAQQKKFSSLICFVSLQFISFTDERKRGGAIFTNVFFEQFFCAIGRSDVIEMLVMQIFYILKFILLWPYFTNILAEFLMPDF
jgi:hypothetical protein